MRGIFLAWQLGSRKDCSVGARVAAAEESKSSGVLRCLWVTQQETRVVLGEFIIGSVINS